MKLKVPPPLVMLLIGTAMYFSAPHLPVLDVDQKVTMFMTVIVFMLGLSIVLLAVFEFNRAKTTVDPLHIEKASTLVTSGVFGLSRNPMYLSFALFLVALLIYLKSPLLLVGVVVFVLYMTKMQILPEEQIMASKFGEEYRRYKQKVRRWI